MKKNRAIVAALLAMVMLLLCACGSSNGTANNGAANNAPATNNTAGNDAAEPADNAGTEDTSSDNAAAEPAEFDGKIHGPFIMTTCGQSTGSVMLHMVATQAGLTSTDDHSLTADTFEAGDAKTLVVTTGTSGKGMGAAGTDVNAEIERCTALVEAAKAAGLTIVCAHVEGMSRRTDNADQASIDAIMPLADVIMVVEDSDSDGLFSDYAAENNIPIIKAVDTLSMSEYMA